MMLFSNLNKREIISKSGDTESNQSEQLFWCAFVASTRENLYIQVIANNNKKSDQPAHPRSPFVIRL